MQEFISTPLAKEILRVVAALAAMAIGFRLVNLFIKRLPKSRFGKKLEPSALSFMMSLLSILLKVFLIFVAAEFVGVPSSSLIALLGSICLAIGLALQGSLSNFAGGLMILAFKPFKLGDYIEEPGGKAGYVEDISIFYTTLRTRDCCYVVLPNGNLSNGRVVNYSSLPYLRIDPSYSVAYGTDSKAVISVLNRCVEESPYILSDPSPAVALSSMAESALIFTVYAYCTVDDYFNAAIDLNLRVKEAFESESISIPFPQLDVHLGGDR